MTFLTARRRPEPAWVAESLLAIGAAMDIRGPGHGEKVSVSIVDGHRFGEPDCLWLVDIQAYSPRTGIGTDVVLALRDFARSRDLGLLVLPIIATAEAYWARHADWLVPYPDVGLASAARWMPPATTAAGYSEIGGGG